MKESQEFIQAVLLMSIYEQRLIFRMLQNASEGLEVLQGLQRGHGGALMVGIQGEKTPEKFWFFYISRTNK